MLRHGDLLPLDEETVLGALDSDDPALAFVHADMTAWMEAHPCECDAGCECEAGR